VKVDREKIRQKLQFMRQELRELKRFQGMDLDQFKSNRLYEAAATRMLQVTIEAMLDICSPMLFFCCQVNARDMRDAPGKKTG